MDLLPSAVSSFFMNTVAPALAPVAQVAATGAGLASGTPDAASAFSLFGGLFDDEKPAKLEPFLGDEVGQLINAQKLRAQFDVNGSSAGPNNVSDEQFNEIVKLYTDIERGKTDIRFDTSGAKDDVQAAALKEAAMGDMAKMLQTESGREMLATMAHNPKSTDKDPRTTVLQLMANPEMATKASSGPAQGLTGDQDWDKKNILDPMHNGAGVDSRIRYVPGHAFLQTGDDGYECQQTGDTVLFHEMVHSYHQTQGTLAGDEHLGNGAVHPLDRGIERDEYQASGLGEFAGDFITENQYREERRYGLGDESVDYRGRYNPRAQETQY